VLEFETLWEEGEFFERGSGGVAMTVSLPILEDTRSRKFVCTVIKVTTTMNSKRMVPLGDRMAL
jgi:hypothetical protein